MKKPLIKFSVDKPKLVFILLAFLSFLTGLLIFKIQIDTDPENMLPESQMERVFHNQVKKDFNLYDLIVVGLVNQNEKGIFNKKSLINLHQLTNQIKLIEGVVDYDVMSLATVDNITQTSQKALKFEWMMKTPPKDLAGVELISNNVDRLPLFQNTLVSEDDKAAAIYVPIKDKNQSYRVSTEIQQIINRLDTNDEFHITGLPVAEDTFGFQMFVQMGISAPLAGLMIFFLMWVFFKNFKFIAAPMIVAMATVIITMGLMIGMGFTVHIMSSMIPIFLMPIAVVDSIHIMSDFADTYDQKQSVKDRITEVTNHLYKPMLFTSITSAVGFASLMLTPIPPVQIFGAFVAFGILLAFLLTIIFIPAYLVSLKPSSLSSIAKMSEKSTRLQNLLKILGSKSHTHNKIIMLVFSIILVISIMGIQKIQINDNPVRWFKSDHKIRIADKVLNQHFAGTYDAFLILERDHFELKGKFDQILKTSKNLLSTSTFNGLMSNLDDENTISNQMNEFVIFIEDVIYESESINLKELEALILEVEALLSKAQYFQTPEALKLVENIQYELMKSGAVGKSNSIADVVKTVNRELKSGKQRDYVVPTSKTGISQALLQYQSSHRPQDLWHMVTKDYSSTAIWVQLKSGDNQNMTSAVEHLDKYLNINSLDRNIKVKWAGKTYLNKVWQEQMVSGMRDSLLSAFVVVFMMMVLLFRSFIFGFLAMLPLTLTISFIYGVIGWIGKDYDMPIAVLSALTLGLSVDFAIHFLQRYRDIFAKTKNIKSTLQLMFDEPASAISRNAIVIAIGFTPLLFAPLVPYITVGFFLATIMIVSALVTLLLLPATLSLFKKP